MSNSIRTEKAMKVMTFNLRADNIMDIGNRWRDRSDMVYRLINESGCDVIGLQEVTNKMEADLKRNIKNYHQMGVSRTKNWFVERNTLLIRKEYRIIEEKTFWLSKRPEKESSSMWHSLFPRICTMAICEYQGKKLAIYNTHLDCLSPLARKHGLEVVLKKIKEQQTIEEMPYILMGDFNAKPHSKVMKKIKDQGNTINGLRPVQDSKPELYKQTTMSRFKGKDKGRHIDYIFVSKEFDILDVKIVKYNQNGKYPSDHYPIQVELK